MSLRPRLVLLLLLLCLALLSESKRQPDKPDKPTKAEKPRQPPPSTPPPRRPRGRSVPGSGELTTKEGHRCTWRTSGEGLVSLTVNCSTDSQGALERYWCRYAGKPDLCAAYGVKSSQYWKQLVGKLKKRQQACSGEKVLKAKTCKKAPAEAHMKLAQRSGEGGEEEGEEGRRGRKKEKTEKKRQLEEEEEEKRREERTGYEEGLLNDMDPVQSYCGDGWNSLCSFFTKFFQG